MTEQHLAMTPGPLQDYLRRLMQDRGIPGLQIAVVRHGKTEVLDAFGIANVEHQVPVIRESVFSINSMAKAFTGIALMQLVEDGLLDLSQKISVYLDDMPEHWSGITVRHLATLTSGVPEMMVYTREINVALIGDGTEQGAWQATYAAPMEYPTGLGYAYTQTNFALLGRIISRLSGMSFEEFVARRQLEVAGMAHTSFGTDQDIIANRANTYMNISATGEPAGRVFNSHLNWPAALRMAAGMQSTAEDLAQWIVALQTGRLLQDRSSIETMLTAPTMHDGRPGVYGIGWHLGRSKHGRLPAPGGGAKAQVVLYPEGLSVVVLTNLLGAFPEHLAPVSAKEIDLSFIDPIADFFS